MKNKIIVGLLLLFICGCSFFGEMLKLYDRIWWWDVMLHIVSGATFVIIGFMLAGKLNKHTVSPLLAALFAFSFAVMLGVLWEVFEFVRDSNSQTNMQRWQFMPIPQNAGWLEETMALRGSGLIDTMKDLIFGMLSAMVASVIGYFRLKRKNENFVKKA